MNVPFLSHHALRIIIAKNTTAQIVGKLLTSTSVFIVSISVARLFGSTGYGEFSKITTFVPLFYLFSDFGLNAIYLQEATRISSKISWRILLATRIIGSLILSAAAILLIALIPTGTSQGYTALVKLGILINIPSIFFQSLLTTGNVLFQKNLRYDLSAISVGLGALVLSLFLVVSPLFATRPEVGILVSIIFFVLSAGTMAVTTLYFARSFTETLVPDFNFPVIRSLIVRTLPLGLTLVANLVYFRIDSIILTLTRPTEEVGFYGIAYKFFEFPLVLPVFFMNTIYPMFLKTSVGREATKKMKALMVKSAYILLFSGLLTTVVFLVGAPYLSLIRSEFSIATPYLRILSLGLPFFFLSNLTMWLLITYKKTVALWLIYTAAMATTILLAIFVIPKYGALGASVLTVLSEAMLLAVSTIYLIQLRPYER